MPTIKDVAKDAGVSIATVSYVLNNKTSFVSEDTRQIVLKSIKRVGYTPSITARNLQANQTRLIGYAWHPVPNGQVNPVLDQFTYYMAQAAEEARYHILTFTCSNENPVPVYEELIKQQRVDAFVLAGTNTNDARIEFLTEKKFPFVCFGRSNPEWQFDYVDTDGEKGMREATEYLIGLGHRKIAMVAWPKSSLAGNYRLQGYMNAMRQVGLPVPPEYIIHVEQKEESGHEALRRWLQLPKSMQPTAILAVTDLIAIGIMHEARQQGIVVGRDLSVIGYDNAPLVEYFSPALTTLEQQIPQMGQILMQMIENMFQKKERDFVQLLVPPRFIIRESCGVPNESTS